MKQVLLILLYLCFLNCNAKINGINDNDRTRKSITLENTGETQHRLINNYGMGYYASSRLPIGYQFFAGFENIGRIKANMAIMVHNQFSTHGNYDMSGTVFKKNLFISTGIINDLSQYNYRIRKLHFSDKERTLQSHKVSYGVVIAGMFNVAAGADIKIGEESEIGLLTDAGRYFPSSKVSINSTASFFSYRTDYRFSITRTFVLSPDASPVLGTSVFYENFNGYSDFGIGVIVYL